MKEKRAVDSSGKIRDFVFVECNQCGGWFWKAKRFLGRHNHSYCSRKCSSLAIKVERKKLRCSFCGKTFSTRTVNDLRHSRSGLYFCSRFCKDRGQRIENGLKDIWPNHYGNGNGAYNYRKRAIGKYGAQCCACGYGEHEEALQVHHIDGDRKNNSIENLVVLCANCHWLVTLGVFRILDRKLVRVLGPVAKSKAPDLQSGDVSSRKRPGPLGDIV